MNLYTQRLTDTAMLPTRGNPGDAGLDFYADAAVVLAPMHRYLMPTGIAIQLPDNTAGFMHPRSGLGHQHGVSIVNAPGTIDQGYRGEVMVNLINLGHENVEIAVGDRIGQLIVQPVLFPAVVEVQELDASERGEAGHGSTGR